VAHQVDGNVDLLLAQPPRDLLVARFLHETEVLERPLHARPQLARALLLQRKTVGFEAGTVMLLQQAGDQVGHGVVPEVRGEVSDPDAAIAVALPLPERRRRRRECVRYEGARAAQLALRIA